MSLPGGSPVAHHGGVMVIDVLHHLPLVVDISWHHGAVDQHLYKYQSDLQLQPQGWMQSLTVLGVLPAEVRM